MKFRIQFYDEEPHKLKIVLPLNLASVYYFKYNITFSLKVGNDKYNNSAERHDKICLTFSLIANIPEYINTKVMNKL